ncbi:MAG: AAA family ATPase [Geodermatophilaceae bacterium]|nr:AAA family ATPase [Geodermatophilaceae bacterium]
MGGVRLLGPVEVTHGDLPISVGGPIPRLLLVQLVLAAGRSVPDDQAIDAVWGDWPPDSVAAALRVHMTYVRRAVRPLAWTVDRAHHGYALSAADVALDVNRLDTVEQELRDMTDPLDTLSAVERGLALWRGPSLTDLRRLPLGGRLAATYDRRQESLVDRRLELFLRLGRARDALAPLHRLVREDPLNEGRWALLAEALYRAGHPAEALAAVADARKALDEQAGLLPGPTLRTLQQRILDHEFEELPLAAVSSHVPERLRALPKALDAQAPERLIGRREQLRMLSELLTASTQRAASSVVRIHGESGVGKSALAAHLARDADRQGMRVLYGWAEADATRTLGLLAEPLAEVVGSRPHVRSSESGRALGRVLGWRPVDDTAASGQPAEPGAARAQLIDAVRRALSADVAQESLVVVLDDVQWADEISLAVLRSIARFPLPRPLLLVLLERSGSSSAVAGRGVVDLDLTALTEDDIATWANQPAGDWTRHLVTITGGLPLLLEGVLQRARAGSDPSDMTHAAGRLLLRDRSAGLSARTSDALIAAAVLGPSFRFDHLLALTRGSDRDLVEDLDAAVRVGVLAYDSSDPALFRFPHDLLRGAVLEDVTPLRRSMLHAEVLRVIADLPSLVAVHHAQSAGTFLPAQALAELTLRAAEELLDTVGFDQARSILSETLQGVRNNIPAAQRALLLTALARAEAAQGDPVAARAHLSDAQAAAATASAPEVVATVVLAESLFGQEAAQDAGAAVRLAELFDALPDAAIGTRLQVMNQLAFAHVNGGRLAEAANAIERARGLAAELGSAPAEVSVIYVEYLRCLFAGETTRRAALVARAGLLVGANSDPGLRARYLGMSIVQSLNDGQFSEADHRAEELADVGNRTGSPYSEWIGLAGRFSTPFMNCDLVAAHSAAERAFSCGSRNEIFGASSAYAGQLFALGWVQGKLDAIAQPTEAPSLDGPQLAWHAVRALALALTANHGAAAAELTAASELIPVVGAHWIGFVGLALAVEAAAILRQRKVLSMAEPILRRRRTDHVILGTGALDLGPVRRYLGLALNGLGRRDEALSELDAAHSDPRSGRIWQLRAAFDLSSLGAAPTGSRLTRGDGLPWAWLPATESWL